MNELMSRYYKEIPVEETINKIKDILNNLGFKVEEVELNSGIDTFSHSIYLLMDGQMISATNGKGNTREYSLASAYAEMMERIQCNPDQFLRNFYQFCDKDALSFLIMVILLIMMT